MPTKFQFLSLSLSLIDDLCAYEISIKIVCTLRTYNTQTERNPSSVPDREGHAQSVSWYKSNQIE